MRSKRLRMYFLLLTFGMMLALTLAYSANLRAAEPCLQGKTDAWRSGDPSGEWTYRFLVHWETEGEGPEEFLLLLGLESCGCACDRFEAALPETVGYSMNEPGIGTGDHADLYVHYRGEYSCDGFPGTPAVPAIRIVPLNDPNGPGPRGTAEFRFHANWPPAAVADPPGAFLMLQAPEGTCVGSLDGVLPECRCVIEIRRESWSNTKKRFR